MRALVLAPLFLAGCGPGTGHDGSANDTGRVAEADGAIPRAEQGSEPIVVEQLPADRQRAALIAFGEGKEPPTPSPCAKVPPRLYLGMSRNKEWPPFYRHAWGEARVSTRADMSDRYPVAKLMARVEMPALGSPVVDQRTCSWSGSCRVDAKFGGTIFGAFTARWSAEASHPCFGTWRYSNQW